MNMQKKLIVLAIAGLSAGGAAFAQSNVVIYGRMDIGAASRGGSEGSLANRGTRGEIVSGLGAGSRLGFKGTEDLGGNGLKAVFEMEYGLANDSGLFTAGNATFNNRHSYVGLTGGFGTVVAGRLDGGRYNVMLKYDANGGYGVANTAGAGMNQGYITRADNAIAYISPSFNGFSFIGAYVHNLLGQEGTNPLGFACGATTNANCGDLRDYMLQGNYGNGPIAATLNYERVNVNKIGSTTINTWQLGGAYDFSVVKLMGVYDSIKGESGGPLAGINSRQYSVGVQVPFGGAFQAKLGYARHDDKSSADQDCGKWGAGLTYDLSKRTKIYTDYGRVKNRGGAKTSGTCGITTSAAQTSLDAGGAPFGTHGFDVGFAHNF
jgi:predicted porin